MIKLTPYDPWFHELLYTRFNKILEPVSEFREVAPIYYFDTSNPEYIEHLASSKTHWTGVIGVLEHVYEACATWNRYGDLTLEEFLTKLGY